uniref:Fatty-acid and retinol-binding protein 1 n=1 Tax=Caenorhabditis japonica TaxID=281687 RepID=A0A8R1DV36_CAEJA
MVTPLPFFLLVHLILQVISSNAVLISPKPATATIPMRNDTLLPLKNTNSSVIIPKIRVPAGNFSTRGFSKKNSPKLLAIQRFKIFVSEFFTDSQISKSIDVAAVGMHKGKTLDTILDDVYTRLLRNLSTAQITELAKAQKGLVADLDEKSARLVKSRIRRMIIYSFDPAAEQIHKFATRPSMAFTLIAETLNERFVGAVRGLIRDVLTTREYDVFRKHYSPRIFKMDDVLEANSSRLNQSVANGSLKTNTLS